MTGELEDLNTQFGQLKKQKTASDKTGRALDEQLNDSRSKISELESLLSESEGKNVKAASEAANLSQQLEETEHKLGITTKNMKVLDAQLTEAKNSAGESKVNNLTIILVLEGQKRGLCHYI